MTSFSIVTMMREDTYVLNNFVDYYLKAGASKIFIYFDGPLDKSAVINSELIDITVCDQTFWNRLCAGRPQSLSAAQERIYMACLPRCSTEWLFITDADEYIFGDMAVCDFLANIPKNIDVVRVKSVEAVWGPSDELRKPFGSSYFRTPINNKFIAKTIPLLLYGSISKKMHKGILSHSEGKQFIRSSRRYDRIGNHDSYRDGKALGHWLTSIDSRFKSIYLGHFDAIGFDRWREKWRRRFSSETTAPGMSKRRNKQMLEVQKALENSDAGIGLFKDSFSLNTLQYFCLKHLGLAFQKQLFTSSSNH